MATIAVESFGDDALRKLYLDLTQKDDWDDDCELCRMPTLLHSDTTGKRIHGACTRRTELTEADILNEWVQFRKKMKPIRNKLGARTLGARSRGSKNVTYIQQTTDKKVNTEEKSQKYGVIL